MAHDGSYPKYPASKIYKTAGRSEQQVQDEDALKKAFTVNSVVHVPAAGCLFRGIRDNPDAYVVSFRSSGTAIGITAILQQAFKDSGVMAGHVYAGHLHENGHSFISNGDLQAAGRGSGLDIMIDMGGAHHDQILAALQRSKDAIHIVLGAPIGTATEKLSEEKSGPGEGYVR